MAAGGFVEMASGGRLPGYGGGDRRLILAEDGETVVSKTTSKAMAPLFSAYGVPGYADGGIIGDIVGSIPGLSGLASGLFKIGKWISGPIQAALGVIGDAAGKVTSIPGSGGARTAVEDIAKKAVTSPVSKIEGLVKNKILGPIENWLGGLLAPSPGSPGSLAKLPPGIKAAQEYAQNLVYAMWGSSGPTNFTSLVQLWNGESGWNYLATNPSSGAYGIPQALPADKMASAGADWRTNAATQIRWGLGYIKSTYGSPCAAWSHEQAYGWY